MVRANDACVGVVRDARTLEDLERGVEGTAVVVALPRETGLAEEASSVIRWRARFAGAVFSSRSPSVLLASLPGPCDEPWLSSLSPSCALDCVRFKDVVAGVVLPG